MSQRTRTRTAADEPKRTSRAKQRAAEAEQAPEPAPTTPLSLAPGELARAFRAVAAELERDPKLAARVAAAIAPETIVPPETSQPSRASQASSVEAAPPTPRRGGKTFHPKVVPGAPAELGPGVPDPFALYQKLGEAGLRKALEDLRLGTLRAMVREQKLDPSGSLKGLNDERKLRSVILEACLKRA